MEKQQISIKILNLDNISDETKGTSKDKIRMDRKPLSSLRIYIDDTIIA
jgi:hypothetical protein